MRSPAPVDEQRLLAILKEEESQATSYHNSELADVQEDAMKRFYGEPYGDEVENRSRVVSRDLEDTINWIMPDLMRTFTASEDLVSIKARRPEDDQKDPRIPGGRSKAELQASYLSHVFFEDNDGATAVYDWLFDGLLQRLGVMSVAWEDPEPGPAILVEGIGFETFQKYVVDPDYEILGADQEDTPQGPRIVMEVRRKPRMGRVKVECVPPEEFAISRYAEDIDTAPYHRRKRRVWLAELKRMYPDRADDLDYAMNDTDTPDRDERFLSRHHEDTVSGHDPLEDDERRMVYLDHEFIRIDMDGDGIVELRQIKRVGDVILENIAVECSDYVPWTPGRVPHKVIGRSLHDVLTDIQRIRTVIMRRWMDALGQTVTPRTVINKRALGEDGIDAVIANDIGGVIPVDGNVNEALREIVTPDVSGTALSALEYFEERASIATGVTKQAQGMDPAAMNKTATGIDLLQAAAKIRIEQVARWAGHGLEKVFKRINSLLVRHQDQARQVKLFGQWIEVDPRTWSDDMAVAIDIGSAGVSKQQRLANLMLVAQKQEQIFGALGPGNPLVTIQHYRNTLIAMASDMLISDPTRFFGEVPEEWAPEPQQDPKAIEAQAKMQLEQAKAQADEQRNQAKMAADAQIAQMKLGSEREIALLKAQSEENIARLRIQSESAIARERMDREMELARWKSEQEFELAERNSKRQMAAKAATNGASDGGVRFGGQIG